MLGFRVWEVDNKCMRYDSRYFLDNEGRVCIETYDGCFPVGPILEFIPLQSTGLTDSTGKIIYEGDILCEHGAHILSHLDMYVVEDAKQFLLSWGYYEQEFMLKPKDITIIGNKYCNPKLLERLSNERT